MTPAPTFADSGYADSTPVKTATEDSTFVPPEDADGNKSFIEKGIQDTGISRIHPVRVYHNNNAKEQHISFKAVANDIKIRVQQQK